MLEHPDITRMESRGTLKRAEKPVIEVCKKCDNPLYENTEAVQFGGDTFCDTGCLTDAFADDPERYGAETLTLN